MKFLLIAFTILLLISPAASHAAEAFLVHDGQPRAEIVIAESPQRSVRLAAQELQDCVAKISGAHLPIVTKPSGHAARIFVGKSSHTDALRAAPEADYLEAIRVAADLARQGQRDEALAAYSAAAEGKITDFQKSAALELAAATARALRKTDVADQLTARIPIAAVKKAVEMQALLDQSKAAQVIEQFAGEDIGAWPFWKRGDGFFARGRAYAITKDGKNAKADLTRALEWTGDVRLREKISKALDSVR